ncbi:alpha/beta fold hydrolase [Massilia sp. Mn16-1_5]|uniref:alpha/beta fold hydrolase n=1 Tax=Massilia sp. Mn16-1_5 TaxID=2079199 RepID=UPI00109EA0DE|nr:alpha/beta hydrolase [Massilia sp. Mn16-1_5]THC39114.1 alpha/beta hydrolase [Massilia sp. Mn16-1_5]
MPALLSPGFIRTLDGVDLFYRDWGSGRPVVFVASWSLPSESWSYQMLALLDAGYRVIAFDRRGHGRSSDPGRGYDFDTLAADLAAVLEALDLRDVTLVGHSMGCNEIVRYLHRYGSARVAGAALLGTMTPFVLKTPDNPDGIDASYFEAVRREQLMVDFPQWIDENMLPFVDADTPAGMKDWVRGMALGASLQALVECNRALASTDFRAEMARIRVPVLLISGTADASAPYALTAQASARLLPDARLRSYEGAPHGMFITHRAQVNADLLEFVEGLVHNRRHPILEEA